MPSKCKAQKSIDDFRKAFADNGLELSEQQVVQIMDELSAEQSGELDEKQLDEAAGGIRLALIMAWMCISSKFPR